jgi:rRNA maturation endonuclease Nob1
VSERDFSFVVRCESCGTERRNDDGYDCPVCGSMSVSYDSADAKRWNEHLPDSNWEKRP